MSVRRTMRLPDLYDPEQPLSAPAALPVYYVRGQNASGGFVAKNGTVYNTSAGLASLEGRRVRAVLAELAEAGVPVLRVKPGAVTWQEYRRG